MRFAIVGCGLIGRKRAKAFCTFGHELVSCKDPDTERAHQFARDFGMSNSGAPDFVVVATPHHVLASEAREAAFKGAHVLIEKPGARYAHELDAVRVAAEHSGVLVRVGFNLRYHPAMQLAACKICSGEIGPIMFINARYGHGGRVGYEKEWRHDRVLSGGGAGIDMAIHLVDLVRFLTQQEFVASHRAEETHFWASNVEDNMYVDLSNEQMSARVWASWTEWKNQFSIEIYGKMGKIAVTGLGGSYGRERLTLYRMRPEMGVPDLMSHDFPEEDHSWDQECLQFLEDIRAKRSPDCGIADAQAALQLIGNL